MITETRSERRGRFHLWRCPPTRYDQATVARVAVAAVPRRIEPFAEILQNESRAALRALLARIDCGESFWTVVHAPFLLRSLGADVVRELIEIAYGECGDSYRKMAGRFRVATFKEYKKLTDFLRHHALKPGHDTLPSRE